MSFGISIFSETGVEVLSVDDDSALVVDKLILGPYSLTGSGTYTSSNAAYTGCRAFAFIGWSNQRCSTSASISGTTLTVKYSGRLSGAGGEFFYINVFITKG